MRTLPLLVALFATPTCALRIDLASRFFKWFTESDAVAKLHEKHVASESAMHMIKGTRMAAAPDEAKLAFARGAGGAAVAEFMRLEQENIGAWKVSRIIEAAGADFDAERERERLCEQVSAQGIVMYSFVDCPWCLLAKERLLAIAGSGELAAASLSIVELDDLGVDGKRLRAAIALATGRTSMPAIFIGGKSIGGFTDGDPRGDAALCHEGAPGLQRLEEDGRLMPMLMSASAALRGQGKG